MLRSDSIDALAPALVAAQAAILPAEKDGTNPHFNRRYASLGAVVQAVRPALAANGLAVSQIVTHDGDQLALETILVHTSGQYIGGVYPLRPTKADPQGEGSALTYARRYALASLLGVVADDDDDGNAASRGNERRPRPVQTVTSGAQRPAAQRNAGNVTTTAPNAAQKPVQPPADPFDDLPSASTEPAQAAALAHGSNGNGHLPSRPTWRGPEEAQRWAMQQTDAAGVVIFHAMPHVVNAYNKLRTAYAAETEHPTPAGFYDRWFADVQRRIDEANARLSAELDAAAAAEEQPAF
jgi:hypothetical protein